MTTKIKCLLLDDELPALSYLKLLCDQISGVEVVKAFDDAEKLVDSIHSLDFNTCILDIEMPKLNGLQVAEHLRGKAIIFTTAYKEFAAEAFDLSAVDYIRKPIQKERLEKAITKAALLIQGSGKNSAQFNTDKGKSIILFSDILVITSSETDARDKIIYKKNDQRITLKNISYNQLLSMLPPADFCRVNKKD
ncbi:MAG: LytR/AlgR family response regulator transcription factor, partial [Bacteroidia bacterium]